VFFNNKLNSWVRITCGDRETKLPIYAVFERTMTTGNINVSRNQCNGGYNAVIYYHEPLLEKEPAKDNTVLFHISKYLY